MTSLYRTHGALFVLRSLAHAASHESYAHRIGLDTGLNSSTVIQVLRRLVDRGLAERLPDQPGEHGTPRRCVRLTASGLALAAAWGVMKRETVAAQQLRVIAAALQLPADNPLTTAANRLDHDGGDHGEQLATVTDAVLGPDPAARACPTCRGRAATEP